MKQVSDNIGQANLAMIVCGALVMGVIIFGGLTLMITDLDEAHLNLTPFALVGVFVGMSSLIAAVALPSLFSRTTCDSIKDQLERKDEKLDGDESRKQLGQAFISLVIIRYALLEGGVFLNLMMFFLDKSMIALYVAALGLVGMILFFPFPGKLENWVANKINDFSGKLNL